jgi:hypothetical protein
MEIDTTFDFRSDTPPGTDPDTMSPTLRRYHRLLWSKPLPSGQPFGLVESAPGIYLHHESDLGTYCLSSDAVMATFSKRKLTYLTEVPDADLEAFDALGYTIGGMMVWPGKRIGDRMTINQHRGLDPRIADRFDLTMESIRRHYRAETSPLAETLQRYGDFFDLFGDFAGFVGFFLLDDLVNEDHRVRFLTDDFDDFTTPAIPSDLETYLEFRRRSMDFINARNMRIGAVRL